MLCLAAIELSVLLYIQDKWSGGQEREEAEEGRDGGGRLQTEAGHHPEQEQLSNREIGLLR